MDTSASLGAANGTMVKNNLSTQLFFPFNSTFNTKLLVTEKKFQLKQIINKNLKEELCSAHL